MMMMTSVMTLALTTECACVQGSLTVSVAGCDWTYCVEDQDVSAVQDVGRHHLNKNKQNSLSVDTSRVDYYWGNWSQHRCVPDIKHSDRTHPEELEIQPVSIILQPDPQG